MKVLSPTTNLINPSFFLSTTHHYVVLALLLLPDVFPYCEFRALLTESICFDMLIISSGIIIGVSATFSSNHWKAGKGPLFSTVMKP